MSNHIRDLPKGLLESVNNIISKSKEVEQIDESWSRGSSSSNTTDAKKAREYGKKADTFLLVAKRHKKDSAEYNKNMANHHMALAKKIKHEYHAGQWLSKDYAKPEHDEHVSWAKEYKTKTVNEDAEQIDELSKKTLKSYQKKSISSGERAWNKADKEEDKSMATDGEKYPEKQERHMKAAGEHIKTWRKREAGQKMVADKLKNKSYTKEEVEELDELSKKTLVNYSSRALNDVRNSNQAKIRWQSDQKKIYSGTHPKTGEHVSKNSKEMEAEHDRIAKNREKGVRTAIKKLAKEENSNEEFLVIESEEFGEGEILSIYEAHLEVMFEHGIEKIDIAQLDEISKKTLPNCGKIANKDNEKNNKGKWKSKSYKTADGRWASKDVKEEIEQIDELSKDTLKNYRDSANVDVGNLSSKRGRKSAKDQKTITKRTSGLERVKEKLEAIHEKEWEAKEKHINKLHDDLTSHFHKEAPKVLAKHGYSKVSDGDTHHTWVKPHSDGHVTTVTMSKHRYPNYSSQGVEYHVNNSKNGVGSGRQTSHGHIHYSTSNEDHAEHKKNMIPKFEHNLISMHEKHKSGW